MRHTTLCTVSRRSVKSEDPGIQWNGWAELCEGGRTRMADVRGRPWTSRFSDQRNQGMSCGRRCRDKASFDGGNGKRETGNGNARLGRDRDSDLALQLSSGRSSRSRYLILFAISCRCARLQNGTARGTRRGIAGLRTEVGTSYYVLDVYYVTLLCALTNWATLAGHSDLLRRSVPVRSLVVRQPPVRPDSVLHSTCAAKTPNPEDGLCSF